MGSADRDEEALCSHVHPEASAWAVQGPAWRFLTIQLVAPEALRGQQISMLNAVSIDHLHSEGRRLNSLDHHLDAECSTLCTFWALQDAQTMMRPAETSLLIGSDEDDDDHDFADQAWCFLHEMSQLHGISSVNCRKQAPARLQGIPCKRRITMQQNPYRAFFLKQ